MEKENKVVYVDFSDGRYAKTVHGIEQWDIGVKLAITGIELDENTQVHFSMTEYTGDARKAVGEIKDGILYIDVPAFILEGEEESCYPYDDLYHGYAWVYIAREDSAETLKKIDMRIRKRPKPDDYVFSEEEVKRYDLLEKKFDTHVSDEDVHFTTEEREKLKGIERGAQVNTVTGIKGNSESSYRTGQVNITKSNIGLGNVDNTSDANKPVSTAQAEAINNAKSSANTYTNNTVASHIGTHNTSTSAHGDIRELIENITKALENYYLKSQTYSQEEINQKLSAIPKFSIQPVEVLPTTNISVTTVYLLKTGEETDNLYTEYIYVNGKWEYLGKQTVDLLLYALKKDIPTKLSDLDIDLELGIKSWNKLDDRPFGEEEKNVFLYEVQETRVGTVNSPAMFTKLGFVAGEKYKVIWNGTEYDCEAFEATMLGETGIGIGNKMAIGGENTGEPFVIGAIANQPYGAVIDLTATSIGTVTFGVSQFKEVLTKVPAKYLPEQKENLSEFNNDLYGEEYELENVVPEDEYIFGREGSYLVGYLYHYVDGFNKVYTFYEGVEAVVTFDGVQYKLNPSVKIDDNGGIESLNTYAMGNLSLIQAGEDTGEPFVIYGSPMDGQGIITLLPGSTHTVKVDEIVGTKIKQIPKEFVEAPYGEKEVELLPETTLSFTDGQAQHTFMGLVEGEKYIVNWDGIEYTCVAEPVQYQGVGAIAIGNVAAFMGTGNTGEPFVIGEAMLLGGCMIAELTGKSSVVFSIKHVVLNKIDNKFVDTEWLATYDEEKKVIFNNSACTYGGDYDISDECWSYLNQAGNKVEVIIDGESIICSIREMSFNGEKDTYIGNLTLGGYTSAVDTGESFMIWTNEIFISEKRRRYLIYRNKNSEETNDVTISALYKKANKLPQEYLPEIPTFDLVAMGLPAIDVMGEGVEITTTAEVIVEIVAALEKGLVKIKANIVLEGEEMPMDFITSAAGIPGYIYQCCGLFYMYGAVLLISFAFDTTTNVIQGLPKVIQ